ncbi:MAG: hypothetical protein SGI74_01830, partial [Oligoflexia bacterium]|nr:hypothetical protein [Oligoflexia bacterium]
MKNKNLLLVLSIFVVIRVFLITLNQTVFANTPWMSHMNVDLWGWLEFFKKSHEGLIPYVDYSKEYPVGAGLLYWIMSFFITPGTHQSVPLVHAVFMFVAECVNVILFFKIAELLFPKRIIAAVFLFALNFTALILN